MAKARPCYRLYPRPAPTVEVHDALAGGHAEDGAADDGVQQELGAVVCREGRQGGRATRTSLA